jgi:hypothetical protein
MPARKPVTKTAKRAVQKTVRKKAARKRVDAGEPARDESGLLEVVGDGWELTEEAVVATARRGVRSAGSDLPEFLRSGEFAVVARARVEPSAVRRAAGGVQAMAGSALQVKTPVPDEGSYLLMARHEASGAITFHRGAAMPGRRGVAGAQQVFQVPAAVESEAGRGRRGIMSRAVRLVLVKVGAWLSEKGVGKAAEVIVPKLAMELEKRLWKGRTLGWVRVTPELLAAAEDRMKPGVPAFRKPQRGLLLIHGTFSSAHAAFKGLAGTKFLAEAARVYGTAIHAFNHFTFSQTPAENVRQMLDALPSGEFVFDVITHSRGGLVLRELVEGSGRTHPAAARVKIRKVVMVASPSGGTPLADEAHWDRLLSHLANLLEVLPDHPFVMGAGWLTEALKWFASHLLGNCPGLVSMDPRGDFIASIQGSDGPPAETDYHALVSNYHPPANLLARFADMGIDRFFGGANDLVVPSEGGWRTGGEESSWIAGARIGCFGPGGNLTASVPVNHGTFFAQAATSDFLLACLLGQSSPHRPLPPLTELPLRGRRSGVAAGLAEAVTVPPDSVVTCAADHPLVRAPERVRAEADGWEDEDTLYLTVLASVMTDDFQEQRSTLMLLAQYGSARVAEPFYTRNVDASASEQTLWNEDQLKAAGTRFKEIIAMQRALLAYTNEGTPLGKDERDSGGAEGFVQRLGEKLFNVLFTGQVRRLYDSVVFAHRNRELNIVFTSMVPWLSDLPWEMAWDPGYKGFLSTGNVRFLRNVLTPVPADRITRRNGRLRILVASAQAAGAAMLSDEQEIQRIRDSFRALTDLGLVEVDVIPRCTPDLLHSQLRFATGDQEYDVLHFIGHGSHDLAKGGTIDFERESGEVHRVSARQFADLVRGRGIRIVFLNACETGRGYGAGDEGTNYNRGVAVELAEEGIPAVVANQYSVVDQLASLFSLHFYSCLAHGLSISDSMREARIAVSHSEDAEPMDWAVPVLFARNPRAVLCQRRPWDRERVLADPERVTAVTRRSAASLLRKPTKVAVWSTSPSLSYREHLGEIISELNAAQEAFRFSAKARRIPTSFFSRDGVSGYLDVAKVNREIDRIRKAYGVDHLICITDQPLMARGSAADKLEAIYYHLDLVSSAQVILFSVWGFDPPLTGEVFRAGVANHIGIGLIEGMTGLQTGCEAYHSVREEKHSIGYFNNERSVEHLAGKMHTSDHVKSWIGQAIGNGRMTAEQYEAIRVIMNLYHGGEGS